MLECNRVVKRKITFLTRTLLILVVCVCAVFLLAQGVTAQTTYLIDDNGRILIHTTYTTDPAKILEEAGLELSDADTYTENDNSIIIQRNQTVTVNWNGKSQQVCSFGETVQALLTRMNLTLTGEDRVSVSLSAVTYDGMVISVSRVTETEQTYTEKIPFETIYCYDDSLVTGQTQILVAGVEGQLICTASIQYADGQEISRIQTSQTVVRQPVTQVVAIGTGKPIMMSENSDTSDMTRSGG